MPTLVNDIRGIQGYTGLYQGKRVTVMASGIGIPSISLYAYELYNFYDVKNVKTFMQGPDGELYIIYPYGNTSNTSEIDVIKI